MLLVEGGTRAIQLAEDLRTVPREVNRRFARTIADVVELATLRVREELAVSGDMDKAARIPVVEVSLLLNVSRTMAGVYIDNGLQLRDRFHQTRAAFEAGDIGFTHVREIVTALQALSDELLSQLEPEAILIAQQGLSRSVLRNELDRMVIAVDPDGAAERRKAMKPHRDYRSSRDRRQLHQQRADAQGGGDLCTHHKPACSSSSAPAASRLTGTVCGPVSSGLRSEGAQRLSRRGKTTR